MSKSLRIKIVKLSFLSKLYDVLDSGKVIFRVKSDGIWRIHIRAYSPNGKMVYKIRSNILQTKFVIEDGSGKEKFAYRIPLISRGHKLIGSSGRDLLNLDYAGVRTDGDPFDWVFLRNRMWEVKSPGGKILARYTIESTDGVGMLVSLNVELLEKSMWEEIFLVCLINNELINQQIVSGGSF